MSFQVLKIYSFCLIMSLFGTAALASETKSEEKSPPAPIKRTNEESYATVLSKVQTLEAKVKSGEQEIQKLVVAKGLAKNSQQVNEIIKNMLSLHRELKANIADYERQRSLLKYRYPEKSQSDGREYERLEVKSLEEMEGQASLSVSINKTLKKVRTQYATTQEKITPHVNPVSPERAPASQAKPFFDPVMVKK